MPDYGMQCKNMDFSAFKGVICNSVIALQYGLMAKTQAICCQWRVKLYEKKHQQIFVLKTFK